MQTNSCLSCGYPDGAGGESTEALVPVLNIGTTPLANRLLNENQLAEVEPRYPLELAFCPHCTLLQITKTISPEELFRDYVYFSSFSDTMLEHSRKIVNRLIDERRLTAKHVVVEAASNDGYLLQFFAERNVQVVGIEPARNIAAVARKKGIPTIDEFFGKALAQRLRDDGTAADVFVANNVLAHIPDPNDFVAGIATVLADTGVAVIECPYAVDFVEKCEFDTIYHEHMFYYSLTALDHLFRRHGLAVEDVERLSIHGGSIRLFVAQAHSAAVKPSVAELLAAEADWGVDRAERYGMFASQVSTLKTRLNELLSQLKRDGRRVAAYGASAKGSTLLNHFEIGGETLDFVVDRSTAKQGLYTPGTHLPILPPEKLLEEMPDYTLLLTWNFADEILEQQREYRRRGGRFIIPIPDVRVA